MERWKTALDDFESCCLAPREVRFPLVSERNLSALPYLDKRLMEILAGFKSFCVACGAGRNLTAHRKFERRQE